MRVKRECDECFQIAEYVWVLSASEQVIVLCGWHADGMTVNVGDELMTIDDYEQLR